MAEQTNSKVPQIRFKDFEGEWEEKTLGELCLTTIGEFVIKTRQNPQGAYPVFNGGKTCTGFYDSFNNEGNKIVISARGASAGYINIVRKRYWAGNSCYSVSLKDKHCSLDFFYSFVKQNEYRFLDNRQSANIPSVSKADVENFGITLPAPDEQTQIGAYFRELDQLIGLHQRKHDKLLALKKAMIQKMFPQPGASTPEIRFRGFDGYWMVNALKNAAEITTGFPFKSSDFYDSGTYLVVTNGNIQNELSFVDSTVGNRISIEGTARLKQFVLRVGDILITMDGSVGRTAKVRERNQILAQRVGRLVARLDSEFLYQALNTGDFLEVMTAISHGGTIKHISLNEIGGYAFFSPSNVEEQKKIGTYFRTLDELISKYAIKLKKLKQIKSACLENMFV